MGSLKKSPGEAEELEPPCPIFRDEGPIELKIEFAFQIRIKMSQHGMSFLLATFTHYWQVV